MNQSPSVRDCLDMLFDNLTDPACSVHVTDNGFYIVGLPADVEPRGDFPLARQMPRLTGGVLSFRGGLVCDGVAIHMRISRPRPGAQPNSATVHGIIQRFDARRGPPLSISIAAAERG